MAIRPIRIVPDPVLRLKAKRVKNIDKSVKKLISDMTETLHEAHGAGLAAPQIGISLRVIALCVPDKETTLECAIINPEIVRRKGERMVNEGCLSIPGYVGEIKRSEQVRIKGIDPDGKEIKMRAEGLLAQALEHEIDHLNGVLYVDHLESQDKLRAVEPEPPEEETSEPE